MVYKIERHHDNDCFHDKKLEAHAVINCQVRPLNAIAVLEPISTISIGKGGKTELVT